MGFFKDFKRDFAQAVNELIPDRDEFDTEYDDEDMVNTFDDNDNMDIAPEDLLDDLDDDIGFNIGVEPKQVNIEFASKHEDTELGEIDEETGFASIPEAELIASKHDISVDSLEDIIKVSGDGVYADYAEDASVEETTDELKAVDAIDEQNMTENLEDADKLDTDSEEGNASSDADKESYEEEGAEADGGNQDNEAESEASDTPTELNRPDAETSNDADTDIEASESETKEAVSDTALDNDEPEPAKNDVTAGLVDVDLKEEALKAVMKQEASEDDKKEHDLKEDDMAEIAEANIEVDVNAGEESFLAEDTTYITKGTTITGNITTEGGIDIIGTVEGDVDCKGKLIVGGAIKGNVTAGEIYANAAKLEGEIMTEGSVKIGVGSVVVGNVTATSAVVAGAVNGDIDVHGPVIVDSTAVIMGNIKSRSVQINNGAVIEGFCSQCYSEIDVKSFFE